MLATPKKKLNGLHGGDGKQRKSPVAAGAGGVAGGSGGVGPHQQATPLNFSGKSSSPGGGAGTPDSGKKRPGAGGGGGGGLYRPYSTSPTPSKQSPGNNYSFIYLRCYGSVWTFFTVCWVKVRTRSCWFSSYFFIRMMGYLG